MIFIDSFLRGQMYSFPLISLAPALSFILCVGIAIHTMINGLQNNIRRVFLILILASAWWCFGNTFELAAQTLEAKLIWVRFQYATIVLVPVLFLYFAQVTSGSETIKKLLPPWGLGILLIIEYLIFVAIMLNEYHGWIFENPHLIKYGSLTSFAYNGGWLFWVMIIIQYLQMICGLAIFVHGWLSSGREKLFRNQMGLMALGSFIPLTLNAIYVHSIKTKPIPLDLTPLSISITVLVLAYSINRFKFLKITPIQTQTILNSLEGGIIVCDPKYFVIDINPAARRLLALNENSVVGKSLWEVLSGDSTISFAKDTVEKLQNAFQDLTSEGIPKHSLEQTLGLFDTALNRRRFFKFTLSGIYSGLKKRSRFSGILIQIIDVTEEHQSNIQRETLLTISTAITQADSVEGLLKNIVQKIGHIMDMPIVTVWICDEMDNKLRMIAQIGLVDELAEKIRIQEISEEGPGIASRTAFLRQPIILENASESPLLMFAKEETVNNQSRTLISMPLMVREDLIGVLQVVSREIREVDNEDIRMLKIVTGQISTGISRLHLIEELKKKNIYLQIQSEKAQEAVRLKSQFLSNISHQLRTPLNSIIGFTKIIINGTYGTIPQTLHEPLEIIHRSGEMLLKMISELLELSRIEAGKVVLNRMVLDCQELVEEVVSRIHPMAIEKGLALNSNVPVKCYCLADHYRVIQVLSNLLENAIKFTEKGNILVEVFETDESVLFSVSDTGIGIPEEARGNIFSTFAQINPTPDDHGAGTGLGLAIAKELVLMHGGAIWAESVPGKGSTFYFTIPKS